MRTTTRDDATTAQISSSEMVPIERIVSEMGRSPEGRRHGVFLVNTSDLRPVPMTTNAVMEIAWKGIRKGARTNITAEWTSEQFGRRQAPR